MGAKVARQTAAVEYEQLDLFAAFDESDAPGLQSAQNVLKRLTTVSDSKTGKTVETVQQSADEAGNAAHDTGNGVRHERANSQSSQPSSGQQRAGVGLRDTSGLGRGYSQSGDVGRSGGVDGRGDAQDVSAQPSGEGRVLLSRVQLLGDEQVSGAVGEAAFHLAEGQSRERAQADDSRESAGGSLAEVVEEVRPGVREHYGSSGSGASFGEQGGRESGTSGDYGRGQVLGSYSREGGRDAGSRPTGRRELLEALDLQAVSSAKERARKNIAALRILQDVSELSGWQLSDAQRATLRGYSGWGGCADAFSSKPDWAGVAREVRELLNDEEYAQARSSSLTAFYTPRGLVEDMWGTLSTLLDDPKQSYYILEPGCGTGNFLGARFDEYANTRMWGVELDPVSARIAQLLNPDSTVVQEDISRALITGDSFDAAIGNVPYSGDVSFVYRLLDGRTVRLPLHDYCIARSVDALRPGGVAVLLTSRFTLDKRTETFRADLARKADLIGVVRLPNITFSLQAGTQAVTDVLVLQKRSEVLDSVPDVPWLHTAMLDSDHPAHVVNQLIAHSPDRYVAGSIEPVSGRFGGDIAVLPPSIQGGAAQQISNACTLAAEKLAEQVTAAAQLGKRAQDPSVMAVPRVAAPYEYMLDEKTGTVWFGGESMVELAAHGESESAQRLRGMVAIRDKVIMVQQLELSAEATDEQVDAARAALNATYDAFVAEFGNVSDKKNMRLYHAGEAYTHLMHSLEAHDSKGSVTGKADIFSKRTLLPARSVPERVESVSDAVAVSLDRSGELDEQLIAQLLDVDESEVEAQLSELAVRNPETGSLELLDDYLSGDVVAKQHRLERLARNLRNEVSDIAQTAWQEYRHLDLSFEEYVGNETVRFELSGEQAAQAAISNMGAAAWQCLMRPNSQHSVVDVEAVLEKHMVKLQPWEPTLVIALAAQALDEMSAQDFADNPIRIPQAVFDEELAGSVMSDYMVRQTRHRLNPLWSVLLPDLTAHIASVLACSSTRVRDVSVLVYKLAHSSKLTVEDKQAIFAGLFDSYNNYRDPVQDTVIGTALRSLYPEDTPVSELTRELATRPELSEYLFEQVEKQCGWRDEQQMFVRGSSPRDYGWRTRYQDLVVSQETWQQFCDERAAFMNDFAQRSEQSRTAAVKQAQQLEAAAARLEAVRPNMLTSEQISMPLGAPWIPAKVVYDFMRDTFALGKYNETASEKAKVRVDFIPQLGQWRVAGLPASKVHFSVQDKYGTVDYTPYQLLERILNNAQVQVFTDSDERTSSGSSKRVLDPQATVQAMGKADAIRSAFQNWLDARPAVVERLTRVYNDRFNTIRAKSVNGSYLTMPGMAADIELRDHQKNAVARAVRAEEGTLIAHVVGAGKTFEGIAITQECKRLGKAHKPMIVVPNHLVDQWAADYTRLYPTARIMSMDKTAQSSPEQVRDFWGRVMTGDWDAVIVPQSRFSQLHMSREVRVKNMQARVQEYVTAVEEAVRAHGEKDPTVKRLEGVRKSIQTFMEKLRDGKESRDEQSLNGITFEQLGVDMLFVDEAHNFKNLGVPVAAADLGMNVSTAAKSEDLLDKCKYLRDSGNGGNIVFATGTPVSNSMSELYNMQRYLAPKTLESQGLNTFAAWAAAYGQVVPSVELKPEGSGFQVKQRFARFQNLPELMAAVKQFTDVITNDDIELDLPELESIPVAVPITESQAQEMKRLADRADLVRSGAVSPDVDNLLRITGDGRKIALDPKLLNDGVLREPLDEGKVDAAARTIARIWSQEAPRRGTQLVFCDSSTPASGKWNIYHDLKKRLIEQGVDEKEIAFVHDAGDNPAKREALFEKVRQGDIRVLIGSTQKLGTGTNVQERLCAIHDLDCPWRPADLEQRLGRIVRQGNQYTKVQDYRYVTEGTFDAYSYQTVERKQRFIAQIMTSKTPAREASDLDADVVTLANIKALATGDPRIQEVLMLENEVNQLKLLRAAHAESRTKIARDIDQVIQPAINRIMRSKATIEQDEPLARQALEAHEQAKSKGTWEGITIRGQRITDKPTANRMLVYEATRATPGDTIATYNGVPVTVIKHDASAERYLGVLLPNQHTAGRGLPNANASGAASALSQIERIIRNTANEGKNLDEQLANMQAALATAQDALNEPFAQEAQWQEKTARLAELRAPSEDISQQSDSQQPGSDQDAARQPAEAVQSELSATPTRQAAQDATQVADRAAEEAHHENTAVDSLGSVWRLGDCVSYHGETYWVVEIGSLEARPTIAIEHKPSDPALAVVLASEKYHLFADDPSLSRVEQPPAMPAWVRDTISTLEDAEFAEAEAVEASDSAEPSVSVEDSEQLSANEHDQADSTMQYLVGQTVLLQGELYRIDQVHEDMQPSTALLFPASSQAFPVGRKVNLTTVLDAIQQEQEQSQTSQLTANTPAEEAEPAAHVTTAKTDTATVAASQPAEIVDVESVAATTLVAPAAPQQESSGVSASAIASMLASLDAQTAQRILEQLAAQVAATQSAAQPTPAAQPQPVNSVIPVAASSCSASFVR